MGGVSKGNEVVLRLQTPEAIRATMTHEMIHVIQGANYEEEPVDFPNPFTAELSAVADLNGDGVMEVVTSATPCSISAVNSRDRIIASALLVTIISSKARKRVSEARASATAVTASPSALRALRNR